MCGRAQQEHPAGGPRAASHEGQREAAFSPVHNIVGRTVVGSSFPVGLLIADSLRVYQYAYEYRYLLPTSTAPPGTIREMNRHARVSSRDR